MSNLTLPPKCSNATCKVQHFIQPCLLDGQELNKLLSVDLDGNDDESFAIQGSRQRRTPPMQPVHQSPRPVAAQASHTVHTRFGRHALEDMISMGRASVAAPMPLHPNTPVSATIPSTNAAAGLRYPPGLQLPQQELEATSAARVTSGSNMHSIKKVKLDSNGLIAVEHSKNVTAEQAVQPQSQLQSPAAMLSAGAAQIQQQGLSASKLAPPSAEVLGAAQHQQQGPPHSSPQAPSTEVLGGLVLHVQEDRRPISPLLQSAARGVPPPPHYQPCVDRAPLRVPRLAAAPDCGNSNRTPYKAAPSIRRMSSGQRVSICMQHLLLFASAACKSSARQRNDAQRNVYHFTITNILGIVVLHWKSPLQWQRRSI